MVVDLMHPTEVSRPFKSGYEFDKKNDYFVAVLDFEKTEKQYNNLSKEEQEDFYCQECVGGTMDISKLTLKWMKKNGLFYEIEMVNSLTTTKNKAMIIHGLSERFNCTPIEFINKIA
jgi:hypothetical protein